MKMKRTEWGEDIDIDEVPEDERVVALIMCVGSGVPWWNFLPQTREALRSLEEQGWTRPS